ncbi:MAG: methylmalonyl-CoA mutase [Hyphomicrobiaceae bacterium]|nr:methylmalonyl-CoA mutase [Hyphomicrobiaceae bacterium]
MSDIKPLADGFAPATEETWRKLVDKALKGQPFDSLVRFTDDGIRLAPLADRAGDAAPIRARAGGAPWVISQRIDLNDPAAANTQALTDLEGGASGLELVFTGGANAAGFGLPAAADALARTLEGVKASLIALRIAPHADGAALAALVADALQASGEPLDALSVAFGIDPFFAPARAGRAGDAASAVGAAKALAARGIGGTQLSADGRIVHEAGATAAQELGAIAAAFTALLKAGAAPQMIAVSIAVDQDVLEGIAKLRALRLVIARILELTGHEGADVPVHAETSARMVVEKDAATNMLRATIACFAAAIGGAESIAVLPYSSAHGLADAFARRQARNTQLVLADESNLYRVADPAAGSGAIETLTDALAEKAWGEFVAIEAEGGLAATLASGALAGRVDTAAKARSASFADKRRQIIGTTKYPNAADTSPKVLATATDTAAAAFPLRRDDVLAAG